MHLEETAMSGDEKFVSGMWGGRMAHHETDRVTWLAKIRGQQKLEMFTGKYYAACATGGLVSAGTAHLLITPFDVLKVNMQANPVKYRNIWSGFGILWKEQGLPGLWKGWGGKLWGYGGQGACKFGFYEYFKKTYSDAAGPVYTDSHRTLIYMAGSASAEAIADVFLCPFEAVKVRVQTHPAFAKGLADGFPKLYRTEGFKGFYKSLLPLWGRNLPFSMVMFASFEHSVDFIYANIVQKRKTECSIGEQLGVTAAAGYTAGVAGSIVSNPADNILTYIYNNKGTTYAQSLRAVGLWGLFTRSLPLRIMLVGPLVTVQWFCIDSLKVLMGLPTSGGTEQQILNTEAAELCGD